MPWLVVIFTWLWPNGSNRTTKKSSDDIIAAAFDCNPTLGERPKGMYLDGEERRQVAAEARDPRKREILWRDTVKYTGLRRLTLFLLTGLDRNERTARVICVITSKLVSHHVITTTLSSRYCLKSVP